MSLPKIRSVCSIYATQQSGKEMQGGGWENWEQVLWRKMEPYPRSKEQCDFACNSYVAQRKGASWSTWPEKTILNLLAALTKNPGPVPGTCIWQPLRPCNSSSRVYLTHSSELLRHPNICVCPHHTVIKVQPLETQPSIQRNFSQELIWMSFNQCTL